MIRLPSGVELATDLSVPSAVVSRLHRIGGGRGTPVGAVIPPGFEAYARIFHPAFTTDGRSLTWAEVAEWAGRVSHAEMQWEAITRPAGPRESSPPWDQDPLVGRCPPEVRVPLVEILGRYTRTPERCHALVWFGFAGLDESFPDAPRVTAPFREYLPLVSPVGRIADGVLEGWAVWDTGPNLWWPEDRAWCVATEVDFCWTYVAGTRSSIDAVLADEGLEALEAHPDQRGDYLSDSINGPVEPG